VIVCDSFVVTPVETLVAAAKVERFFAILEQIVALKNFLTCNSRSQDSF
jgi:hypothetical protein